MIGLFLLVIGLGATSGSSFAFGLLLAGAGIFMLARQYSRSGGFAPAEPRSEADAEPAEAPARQQTGAEQVYAHAIRAAERAGHEPGDMQVLPVDIGVMAFRAGRDPVVYREKPVLDDVDYIQPFVQLRLPTRAEGRIRFEIADSDGQILFIHEDMHRLQRGRNLVTPSARLPIHDAQAMHGAWELRVSADGVPLAAHKFEWHESAEKTVRRHLREDGEMTSELRAAIIDSTPGELSLDELLAYQEDADKQQQRGK